MVWPLVGLTLAVAALHIWLTQELAGTLMAVGGEASGIKRMQAAYVREMKLSTPPVAAAALRRAPALERPQAAPLVEQGDADIAPAEEAASAPKAEAAASRPETDTAETAQAASSSPSLMPLPAVDGATMHADINLDAPPGAGPVPDAPAALPAAGSAPQTGVPPFVWPRATKVSYKLQGYFRGPIHGQAQVEWLRRDQHYQVHVEATVGPSFAPIGSWKLSSEGDITADGLSPQRFEQVNRLLIKSSAPSVVTFEENEVVLPSGARATRWPGMQDASSQFIQLAYRFIIKPELLKVGNTIEMPLALPRKPEMLAYDVLAEETLDTPIGKVPTFHVKPRRMSAAGGGLPAEIWFAPGLQYLPVRILVRVDDKTFMDMHMERAPQLVGADDNIGHDQ